MPWQLIFTPFFFFWFSLLMLLSPQGLVHAAPLALFTLVAWCMRRKTPRLSVAFGFWMLFAYAADLLAWWFSKEPITAAVATKKWGIFPSAFVAGFPVHKLELPPPPMGPGTDILGELAVIIPNLAFWLIATAVAMWVMRVVMMLAPRKGGEPKAGEYVAGRAWLWMLLGAFLCNQLFLATYMLWFD